MIDTNTSVLLIKNVGLVRNWYKNLEFKLWLNEEHRKVGFCEESHRTSTEMEDPIIQLWKESSVMSVLILMSYNNIHLKCPTNFGLLKNFKNPAVLPVMLHMIMESQNPSFISGRQKIES